MKFNDDSSGVSTVLGAVLMLAVAINVLAMIQLNFVPVWDEEKEAEHADNLANQIGALKTELDRQAGAPAATPVTTHLDLESVGTSTFFNQASRVQGSAMLLPGDNDLQFEAPAITVQNLDGTSLLGVNEAWEAIEDGVGLGPIDSLLHLRVRVPNPHGLSAGIESVLRFTDAEGAYAGKLEIINGDDAVFVSAYNAGSETTPITNRLDDTDPDGPTFYFNLLDDNLLVNSIIASAEKPVTITLEDGGLPAEYTIVYDRYTEAGVERYGADIGVTSGDYSYNASAGHMLIHLPHQHLPHQTYVIEHGAVILVQPDGASMIAPPSMTVSSGALQHNVHWTIPILDVETTSLSANRATVTMGRLGGGVTVDASMPQFSLTLPTEYPGLWEAHWREVLSDSGLLEASGEFEITLGLDSATLAMYGPITDPLSDTNDVLIELRQAVIGLQLTPFG